MVQSMLQELSLALAIPGQATGIVTVAGSIVLVLMVVALGGFAYKSVTGDGITWPEETADETTDDEGVERGRGDDEWDYY